MNRAELRELLLSAPRNEENRKKIPSQLGWLWFCKPNDNELISGKTWMYIRAVIILASGFYIYLGSPSYQELRMLFYAVVAYEVLYNSLWKENMQLKGSYDVSSFECKVDEAIDAYLSRKKKSSSQ